MDKIKPNQLDLMNGNICENWRRWSQAMRLCLDGPLSEKTEKQQASYFLLYIGESAREVYNTWNLSEEEKDKTEPLFTRFKEYCEPRKNLTVIRHKFNSRFQSNSETADQFITDLQILSKDCEFGLLKDELIKDRIVCGVASQEVRERLLQESDLTLKKATELLKSIELSKEQTSQINDTQVHAVSTKKKTPQPKSTLKFNCRRCGTKHEIRNCPAWGKTCENCNVKNHLSKMCRKKKKNEKKVHNVNEEDDSDTSFDEEFFVNEINSKNKEEIFAPLQLKIDSVFKHCNFKLDTGAQVNVLPFQKFKKLGNITLNPTRAKLTSYAGTSLKVKGKCDIICKHKGLNTKLTFFVVDTFSPPILGLKACLQLNLIKVIMSVNENEIDDILKRYSNVFKGLGCLKEPYKIEIDKSVSPVIHPPRKVPTSLMKKLKAKLDKMVELDVIKKVDGPTDWVNSMVIVDKPKSNDIRICLDPKDLNKAIKREHYQLPTIEEITSRLAGAKVFSKLDLNSGYWQLKLDEDSQLLTTFNTPFGRYAYKRTPFGIKSAQEVFHKRVAQHFENIPGVETDIDDILIWGKSEEEHNITLQKVLDKCVELNITLNKEKCLFKTNHIEYIGHTITSNGVQPSASKIKAISEMPHPKDKKGVERLLGTVNYLAKFIPNISTIIEPIRSLLKNDVLFVWENPQKNAFNKIQEILSTEPVLKFFDVNEKITISCDASKSGLGAALMQNGKPVSFVSRSMTEAETRYAQIEKELLAVLFSLEKFNQYTYGQYVTVESDHRPLESILKKPLIKAPLRLQRMLLRLQKYNFELKFKPGKELIVADMLSRAYLPDSESSTENEIEQYVHAIIENMPVSDEKLSEIKEQTLHDTDLQELQQVIMRGWPNNKANLECKVQEYWDSRDELTVVDGIILKGDRIVIPKTLRTEMMTKLHLGHFGIEKTKRRARDILYWPGMNAQIMDMVSKCEICQRNKNPKQQKEPLINHQIPDGPWQNVAADLFHWNERDYLLIVDYYSRYFETVQVNNIKSKTVINHMKAIFARHGIPQKFISDNGPCFSSSEFSEFSKLWKFQHVTSSPLYPKSNGLVEKYVNITKKIFQKAKESGTDPYLAMLEYRNCPIDNIGSPAQLLMSRRLNSVLPATSTLLEPKTLNPVIVNKGLIQKQQIQKKYYDRASKIKPLLKEGDNIRILQDKKWNPGTVIEKCDTPRSYIVKTPDGATYRRNTSHLMKTVESPIEKDSKCVPNEEKVCEPVKNTAITEKLNTPTSIKGEYFSRFGRKIKPKILSNDFVSK